MSTWWLRRRHTHCRAITGMGKVNIKDRPSEDDRGIKSTRIFYTWRLDGQLASTVIRDVYPYLIIKRLQAQIVYAMNLSLKWGRPTRSLPVPPDVMRDRRRLYKCVKALNQRQDIDLPPLPEVPPAEEPGWYLRSEITWAKRAPMPESCTDRPTTATEKVFLLTRSARYFYDAEAVKEEAEPASADRYNYAFSGVPEGLHQPQGDAQERRHPKGKREFNGKRNMRNFWLLGPEPFPEAHFATFPTEIPQRAILAGTSARGVCPKCEAGWERIVKRGEIQQHPARLSDKPGHGTAPERNDTTEFGSLGFARDSETIGWRPICSCDAGVPVPATCLDPFLGSGTTALVADRLGRNCIGIELSPKYAAMAERRIRDDAGMFAQVAAD